MNRFLLCVLIAWCAVLTVNFWTPKNITVVLPRIEAPGLYRSTILSALNPGLGTHQAMGYR